MFQINKKIQTHTIINISKILNLLREYQVLHIRGIARIIGISSSTVERIVNSYLEKDFVTSEFKGLGEGPGGFRVREIRLRTDKINATTEDVLKVKRLRESLNSHFAK